MSLTVDPKPISTVSASPLANSFWNAVHNPIIFRFTRSDYAIDHIVISGSTADIYPVSPDSFFTDLDAGAQIYVNNPDMLGLFGLEYISGGDHAHVYIGTGFVDGTYSGGSIIIPKSGYRIEVEIGLKNSGSYVALVTSSWVPDTKGIADVDVSEYIKPQMLMLNDYDYSTLNVPDENLSQKFQIKYREVWTGHTGDSLTTLAGGDYYAVNAAKQIGDLYGGNMGEFVTFPVDVTVKAKFLSGFLIPHYWVDFPFDLSFVYGESFSGAVTRKAAAIDVNGGSVTLPFPPVLDAAGVGFVNRLEMPDPGTTSYYMDLWLTYSTFNITEVKRIRTEHCEDSHNVYLCWKNKNGGWDYWLFQFNQTRKRAIGGVQQFEKYITDFANATSRIRTSSKSAVPSLVIGASGVSSNDMFYNEQFPGLTGLLDSVEVLMLRNPATGEDDGAKWFTVNVKPGSFTILETRNSYSQIELEITLPTVQIEKQ